MGAWWSDNVLVHLTPGRREAVDPVDIRELARRSGVSVATVSRALNDRPDVSVRTRDRIVAMARELGYRPNQQARSLVRRRSGLLGLLWDTGYALDDAASWHIVRRQP